MLESDMKREHKKLKEVRIQTEDIKKLYREMMQELKAQALIIEENDEEISQLQRDENKDQEILREIEKIEDERCRQKSICQVVCKQQNESFNPNF